MFNKITHTETKSELGPIETGIDKSNVKYSRKREPLTIAIAARLKKMNVGQSFLITVQGKKETEAMRARVFCAAKETGTTVSTRTRTQKYHDEVGLRVWKERKKAQEKRFTLADR